MFPLSDSAKAGRFPVFTVIIILINAYVFYLELTSPSPDAFIAANALTPAKVNFANFSTLPPFLTSLFLHGGFLHIISNMWFLWIFGDNVESYFGGIVYVLFYLAAGVIGSFLQYFLDPVSQIPMLGASGAISGIMGAYYVLFPQARVKSLVFIFIFITVIEIPAVIYLFYWFFLQLFSGISSIQAGPNAGGIAFWAHVGGFITGIFVAKAMQNDREKGYIEGEILK